MKTFKVTADDVQQVAKDVFGKKLTKKQVKQVIQEYPNAQEQDPSGTWDLVVEDQIYTILEEVEDND